MTKLATKSGAYKCLLVLFYIANTWTLIRGLVWLSLGAVCYTNPSEGTCTSNMAISTALMAIGISLVIVSICGYIFVSCKAPIPIYMYGGVMMALMIAELGIGIYIITVEVRNGVIVICQIVPNFITVISAFFLGSATKHDRAII
ncbi:unnamed protein product [Hymenolepis diminuta]|uniref:Uncharacterized protein n=1 Tax=Hymenolepis diminuta TaxID=6216 RepID=A0A564Z069_HYMDI|nr:unnamed protein product [Hymenolepis diminuta]